MIVIRFFRLNPKITSPFNVELDVKLLLYSADESGISKSQLTSFRSATGEGDGSPYKDVVPL